MDGLCGGEIGLAIEASDDINAVGESDGHHGSSLMFQIQRYIVFRGHPAIQLKRVYFYRVQNLPLLIIASHSHQKLPIRRYAQTHFVTLFLHVLKLFPNPYRFIIVIILYILYTIFIIETNTVSHLVSLNRTQYLFPVIASSEKDSVVYLTISEPRFTFFKFY